VLAAITTQKEIDEYNRQTGIDKKWVLFANTARKSLLEKLA
jgi:hypothetical protein